jgi:hypothetical protein
MKIDYMQNLGMIEQNNTTLTMLHNTMTANHAARIDRTWLNITISQRIVFSIKLKY